MPNDNLIQWLANGPYPIFALIIGVLVSIDVCVVEFTRDYDIADDGTGLLSRIWTPRMRWMAFWHALFHSASFFLYIVTIYLLQGFAFFSIEWLRVPDGVGIGLLTLINFVVVCFIWWTYRSKIKEDHSEKNDDSASVDRRDMKLLVDLVRAISQKLNLSEQSRGVAVAGSVAVDMLAISALLKLYLLPHDDKPAISEFFGVVIVDIFLFATIIFATVFFLVFIAQAAGRLFRNSLGAIIILRLAEPLAVFFVLAGTVRAFMQFQVGNYSDEVHKYGLLVDFLFALTVLVSLVVSNGLTWSDLRGIYKRRSSDGLSKNPDISFREILVKARVLLPALLIVILILCVVILTLGLAYSTAPGPNTHNHLIEATGYFSSVALALSIVFLYSPSTTLDKIETRETANFNKIEIENQFKFWSMLIGVFLGLFALNAFNLLAFGRSFEVDSIMLWSAYLGLTWLLFDLRRWRFFIAEKNAVTDRRVNDADFAELVSTVGVVSALVSLFAQDFVSRLIA